MLEHALTESQLFDFGNQVVRTQIGTVLRRLHPLSLRWSDSSGADRLKPDALRAQGLTANDVNDAINNQNLTVPAGTQKIGDTEYNVKLNASPFKLDEINDLPIRGQVNGNVTTSATSPSSTMAIPADEHRSCEWPARRVDDDPENRRRIHAQYRQRNPLTTAPGARAAADGASIDATGDQSVFVRAAVKGVVMEAVLAACLTALMVLLFLGSWRSTLIIAISIPLSIIASLVILDRSVRRSTS